MSIFNGRAGFALTVAFALWVSGGAPDVSAQTVAQGFAVPPSDTRPLVRWWWFGPAVEQNELAREIAAMKARGFGGFEIQAVYPLALGDPGTGIRNLKFLSDEFLRDVRFANDTGRAQGMRVDVTLGSGWPFGGPHIPVTEASAKIQMTKIAVPSGARAIALPSIGAGERLLAVFVADGAGETPNVARAKHLTCRPDAISVSVTPVHHKRTLLVFVESRTGQQVKRAGLGGEGFVLDHMNAAAVRHHLDVAGEKLMSAFGDNPPYSVFSDSLEVYGADWTDDLLAQFRLRRGYDLTPYLPALFFDTGPQTAAIRHDWGLTLSQLVDERYLAAVAAWAASHRTRFRAQIYGTPPVTLSSNRLVQLAEGEGARWRQFTTMRWASSANHDYGRAVTSAESWTWLHTQPFRATPLDIKVEADRLLLQGVNQFVAHGWPYSPPSMAEPGWAFYAAAVFNDHNPWWPVMGDVNAYLQRLSYLLRQGEPVADVAILLPTDDAFARMTPGHASVTDQMRTLITDGLTQQILDSGYSFDYVDAAVLDAEGFKHKVLILPNVGRIAPSLYRRIATFAKHGGIVIAIGRLPDSGDGLIRAGTEAREVRAISSAIFTTKAPNVRQIDEAAVGAALKALIQADLAGAPPEIGFVHRKLTDGDVYFVANTGNQPVSMRLAFREQTAKAQWWEPRTGEAHSWIPGEEVALAPYESRVFVFGAAACAPISGVTATETQSPAPGIDLSSNWHVLFEGLNHSATLSVPASWTEDPTTRFYSGEAIYTRSVILTSSQVAAGQVILNFGAGTPLAAPARQYGTAALLDSPVREAAEVFVNGKRAGTVWAPPYTLNLAGFLHRGENTLEIRVTNTAINTLAGRPAPDYGPLIARFGERFILPRGVNLIPLPAGILHPVTLENTP